MSVQPNATTDSKVHRALGADTVARPAPTGPAQTAHTPTTGRGEGLVAFDPAHDSLRAPAHSQFQTVELDEVVVFEAQAACTDWDETGARRTAEGVHDSHLARFSFGCTTYLTHIEDQLGFSVLREEHISYRRDDPESMGRTVFNATRWAEYRGCLGNSETEVVENLARQMEADFKLADHGHTVDRILLGEMCRAAFLHNRQFMCRDVELNAPLFEVLHDMAHGEHKIPVYVVSASHTDIVVAIAEEKDGKGPFKKMVGGATKKTSRPSFEGADLEAAFVDMGVSPRRGVMFGDGKPDIGCSILAGCPVTIICDPNMVDSDDFQNKARAMVTTVCDTILRTHPRDEEVHRRVREHKVFFVRSFESLRFAGVPTEGDMARAEVRKSAEYDLPSDAVPATPA